MRWKDRPSLWFVGSCSSTCMVHGRGPEPGPSVEDSAIGNTEIECVLWAWVHSKSQVRLGWGVLPFVAQ